MTDEAMRQRFDTFETELRAQLELLRNDLHARLPGLVRGVLTDLVADRLNTADQDDEDAEFVAECVRRSEERAALRAAANEPPTVPTAEDELDGQ